MSGKLKTAILGATGYSGFELARILLRHPKVQSATFYVRETNGAQCLAEMFPQLRGWGEASLKTLSVEVIAASGAGCAAACGYGSPGIVNFLFSVAA